jgi:hypothetical protein
VGLACHIVPMSAYGIETTVPGFSIASGVFGAITFVTFALDALWSAGDAEDLASILSEAEPEPGLRFAPVVSLVRGPSGASPLLGLHGVF